MDREATDVACSTVRRQELYLHAVWMQQLNHSAHVAHLHCLFPRCRGDGDDVEQFWTTLSNHVDFPDADALPSG